MAKKITDKIKEILTPEDLKAFESAVETMVSEKVNTQVKTKVALIEEEMKNKYDKIAEEYVQKTVAEELEKEKSSLIETYDSKLNNLEKKIVSKLDTFLEHVITENISDDMLEKVAINETLSPVVDGIKKVLSENHIEYKAEGQKVLSDLKESVEQKDKQLSEQIQKNIELEERLEKTATFMLISEKTVGLTTTQKQRVTDMFKNKSFDEVEESIDNFVDIVKENYNPIKNEKKVVEEKVIDKIVSDKDVIEEEKKVIKEEDNDIINENNLDDDIIQIADKWV